MGVSNFQISNRQDLPDNFINDYFRTGKMTVVYAGSIGTANALDVLLRLREYVPVAVQLSLLW